MRRLVTVLGLTAAMLSAPGSTWAQESPTPCSTPPAPGACDENAASPSPAPSCEGTRGTVTVSQPSPRSVVAGQTVTITATLTGPIENFADRTGNSYRWATPTTKAPAEITDAPTTIIDVPEGQTATRTITIRPTTNTRVVYDFGYRSRCLNGDFSVSRIINVAPRLTLDATRTDALTYVFSGVATAPGLVVNLYRINASGSQVLTAQTRATDAGRWSITRTFLGSGRFGFQVRTGRTMANSPGESNIRPTVIH